MRSPLSPTRLHAMVVQDVMLDVVRGQVPPGSALPTEAEMAERYGVSRAVIREAVRVLVEKGLVEVRQGRGSQVTPPERWNQMDPQVLVARLRTGNIGDILHDLMDVRRILEVECAGLAARRATDEDRAALTELMAAMEANLEDPVRYTEHDNRFHQRIWEAARNRLLLGMIQPLAEVFGLARHLSALHGDLQHSFGQHRDICAALDGRDDAAARAAMLRHVLDHEENLRESLRRVRPEDLLDDVQSYVSRREATP